MTYTGTKTTQQRSKSKSGEWQSISQNAGRGGALHGQRQVTRLLIEQEAHDEGMDRLENHAGAHHIQEEGRWTQEGDDDHGLDAQIATCEKVHGQGDDADGSADSTDQDHECGLVPGPVLETRCGEPGTETNRLWRMSSGSRQRGSARRKGTSSAQWSWWPEVDASRSRGSSMLSRVNRISIGFISKFSRTIGAPKNAKFGFAVKKCSNTYSKL